VAIAVALVPTADPAGRRANRRGGYHHRPGDLHTLRQINQGFGMTMLVVSHDPNLSRHTDRVVAIRDGKTSTETMLYARRRRSRPARRAALPGGSPPAEEAHKPELRSWSCWTALAGCRSPRNTWKPWISATGAPGAKGREIAIQPVAGRSRAAVPAEDLPISHDLYVEEDPEPVGSRNGKWGPLRRVFSAFGRRRKPHSGEGSQ
jgi:energy-coupling factor transporter ATP-binding protein EcfA2